MDQLKTVLSRGDDLLLYNLGRAIENTKAKVELNKVLQQNFDLGLENIDAEDPELAERDQLIINCSTNIEVEFERDSILLSISLSLRDFSENILETLH